AASFRSRASNRPSPASTSSRDADLLLWLAKKFEAVTCIFRSCTGVFPSGGRGGSGRVDVDAEAGGLQALQDSGLHGGSDVTARHAPVDFLPGIAQWGQQLDDLRGPGGIAADIDADELGQDETVETAQALGDFAAVLHVEAHVQGGDDLGDNVDA